MASKTKILFLTADAVDTSRLRLGAEVREIEEKIRSSPKANSFVLISQWAIRAADIMQVLMRHRPAVVHFSGHATPTDEIILEDDYGKSKPVAIPQLLNMFSAFNDSIRIVVLNACYSSAGLEKYSQSIEYILGADAEMGDQAALKFAGAFYQALGYGYSVQVAYQLAKSQITMQGLVGAENFNLRIRQGVDASEPFLSSPARKKRSTIIVDSVAAENTRGKGSLVSIPEKALTARVDASVGRDDRTGAHGIMAPEHGVLPTRSSISVPVEIQESFQRFQKDHPDPTKIAFLIMRFGKTQAHDRIVAGIKRALDPLGIAVVRADDKEYHDDLLSNVLTYIHGSGFGIAVFERIEKEEFNPNVALEVGYVSALRKPLCLLKDKTLKTLQADLVGKLYRVFDPQDPIATIPQELSRWLEDKGLDKPANID